LKEFADSLMEVMNGKRLPAIALPLGVSENSYGHHVIGVR